jgi:hypothetical protein
MNYVKHLNAFFRIFHAEPDLDSYHLSLYYALFHLWNCKRFIPLLTVNRRQLMSISKIRSKGKYYQCLYALHEKGFLVYYPSEEMYQKATIGMVDLSNRGRQLPCPFSCVFPKPVSGSALVPYPVPGGIDNGTGVNIGGTDNSTEEVPLKGPEGTINSTGPVPETGHLLEDKPLNNLERGGNGHPPPDTKDLINSSRSGSIPLHLEEVEVFFAQEKYPAIEARSFYHYYQSVGWKTKGGILIKDWKGTAHRWMITTNHQERTAINVSKYGPDQHLHTSRGKDYSEPL